MSVYKDELRKALLFIDDIVREDTHASARASGYLAGVSERLGLRVSLSRITGVCPICGLQAEINSNGHTRSHEPRFAKAAYDGKPGNFCMGSKRVPRVA